MIKNVVEQIKTEIKKYKFKRRHNITTAFMIMLMILSEMFLTSMAAAHENTLYVMVDGVNHEVKATKTETVGEMLCEMGIIMGEYDEMNVSPDTVADDGMNIVIDRVEYIDVSRSTAIDYETIYQESTLYKTGTEFVTVQGKVGCEIVTSTEKLVNGVVVESSVKSVDRYEPVNEVITVGTALNEPYSKKTGNFRLENGIPTEYAYMVDGKVTAYTAPEGAGTYSGRKLEIGTVAVNPDVIPFGSELYICSKDGKRVYGYAIAADTGDLTEVVADVFMGVTSENYDKACDWGAQFCNVYVLTIGDNSVSWM